jgi:SAM-dependent methyltransferase
MEFCSGPVWRQMLEEQILPVALDGVALGDDVIEIGPGPGFVTDVLRQRTAALTAVEIDPGLFDALADRLAGSNVQVLMGDATALDLPSDRFTGGACFNMLHHIPTVDAQQRALAELVRVLKPGGVMVASDAGYSEGSHLFHSDDVYNPIEPGSLEKRMAQAGFIDVAVHEHELVWVVTARAA